MFYAVISLMESNQDKLCMCTERRFVDLLGFPQLPGLYKQGMTLFNRRSSTDSGPSRRLKRSLAARHDVRYNLTTPV